MNVELFLLACALLLFVLALRLRRRTGIPWTPIRSADTNPWQRIERPLISHRYKLTGKPDYLVQMRAGLIPIEVKPSRTAAKPYAGDLLQLAAYCLLVEDTTGQAPPYGLLRYAHRTFRVPYTADLRAQLLKVIADMRNAQAAPYVARSHGEAQRCRACGFFDKCDDRLE